MVEFAVLNLTLKKSTFGTPTIPVISPHDESIIGFTFNTGRTEVEENVKLAKGDSVKWASVSAPERGNVLRNFLRQLENNKDDLVELVCIETGKSKTDSISEFEAMIEMGFLMASHGRRLYGNTTYSKSTKKRISIWLEPIGVCALIVAANTPLPNYAWKVFPALIAGNSVILKPSEFTPFSSTLFTQIAHNSGIPISAFQLMHGNGIETGDALVNSKIDLISFTGSKQTGIRVAMAAAENLTKVSLELGGKNAFIISDDANLELASDSAILSAFSNAGQRCAAASRVIVTDKVFDKFTNMFYEKVKQLQCGNESSRSIGPVISRNSFERINKIVSEALSRGARISAQGINSNKNGFYIKPTVFENVSKDDAVATEEIFGPVCCIFRVKTLEDAILLANDSEYGLTAAVWTNDHSSAQKVIGALQVGMLTINGPTYGAEPNMPFGGVKNSGNGWRENGENVIDIYTEIKTVAENQL